MKTTWKQNYGDLYMTENSVPGLYELRNGSRVFRLHDVKDKSVVLILCAVLCFQMMYLK